MADEVIVIDVTAKFTDDTSSGAAKAQKSISNLEKSADSLSKKKHSVRMEVDDKATQPISKIKSAAKSFASTAFSSELSFKDKASIILDKVKGSAKTWASQKWQSTISTLDKASNIINKASNAGRAFASKAWRTTLSVVDGFTSPLTKLKNMLFNINTLIGAVATGLATKFVVAEPVSLADSISQSTISFQTMLGSEEKGNAMMSDIMAFAKDTPFDTMGVVEGVQQMMAYGIEAENTLKYMEKIGNVMSAMGKGEEGIDSVTRALGQMRSTGKVNAQDMMQLTSVGIKAWDYLAAGMGKSVAQVRKMSEDGAIDAETAINHIMSGLSEFDGMMDKMSNTTVKGIWSNIQDTFSQSIILKWGKGLQKGAIEGLSNFRDMLERIDPLLSKAGTSLEEIGEAISTRTFDVLDGVISRFEKVASTDAFKNADLFGKIGIVWDEVIWQPFSEWWETSGKPKLAEKMYDFGEGIGTGISHGLLTLLGVDITDTLDDGASIGASLAEGFKAGFDGEAVGEALLEAIKSVFASGGKGLIDMLLPGDQGATAGNKILGAGLALGGTYLAAKGITAASSTYHTLSSVASSVAGWAANSKLIGSTGNAMVKGSGLLGKFADVGYGLTGGAYKSILANGSGLTGAGAAAVGGGSIAGGIAAGATLISAGFDFYDMYKAAKSGDETEKKANLASGSSKVAGVAVGAATGAAIGSVIPVVGTAAGALIGAGIGGIAGWLGGDAYANKIREDAAALERETQAARYESEEMKAAIMDANSSAEDIAATFNEVVNTNIAEHFGDVKLSLTEIAELAKKIVFNNNLESFENFASAVNTAEASLYNLETSVATLNKTNWKLNVGLSLSENGQITLSDDEKASLSQSVESFMASAQQFIEDKHYEFTAAVSLLIDTSEGSSGAGIIANGDVFYTNIQTELQKLGSQLSENTKVALSDGILTLDEQAELTNLQTQISEITNKLATAQTEAEFETLKIKFSSGELDASSFASLQSELQAQVESATSSYDNALTTSITSLKLQLSDGALTEEEYNEQLNALMAGYQSNIETLNAQVSSVQLEILGDAYSDLLGEDAIANLQTALDESIKTGINPISWTAEETASLLGLESISEESAAAINSFLSQIASSMATSMLDTDFSAVSMTMSESVSGAITNTDMEPIETAIGGVRTLTETAVTSAFSDPFKVKSSVDISLDWNILNPTTTITASGAGVNSSSVTVTAANNANGGFINSKTLSWLAEEGTPEVVIPLGSHRRERAMSLWQRTGELLGVQPEYNALGGIVGGNVSETPANAPLVSYRNGAPGNINLTIGNITFEIKAGDNPSDILAAIQAQKNAIVELISEALYEALVSQFSNTPLAVG